MSNIDENLAFTPATDLRELIKDKQVSSVEITELFLSRIDRLNSRLNAYLTVTSELAMDTARQADQAVARGDELGPLHGVPISIKDLQMTAGIRTTSGSLAYMDRVPEADSAVAERIRAAGSVILGKTNTPEFGLFGATDNRLGDSCRNPWNPERTSGGSSGGAGASVVAGLCTLATGGDGGGSIRIPASFNGTYGIKPTQGRVSSYSGVQGPAAVNLTSQQGPMSRTVRDSALLLDVLAGYDGRDTGSLRAPKPDFLAAADRGVAGLRVGWSADYGYADVDPEVESIAEAAIGAFAELGCTVEEADLRLESPFDTWFTIYGTNAFLTQGHLLDDPSDPLTWYGKWAIEAGSKMSSVDYARALGERDRMIRQFDDVFERFDILLSPSMAVTAFPVQQYPERINGQTPYPSPAWGYLPFTHPINTIGNAAASIPCGFDSDGMPVGLHIVGRMGDEETVIAASAAFESARPWAEHRPAVS
ncbi:MAG: amidase [SAR202 cluster bacterium]|jgi:aspartyl-tRNA(Asn)/glutamyl-tRNA(Gln) amidotransferase subunit A|nr:amidase [SAR202 cluster bacterium]MDP6302159.1 amidase [SAR202 cluster bacterium]MDP7104878.1 amidase [SAR202 cluster bacterium]MDP7226586.1 amidase [SAR202 cluster bacterium]MDP7413826.1 amidase [SAR202 cluster bacterium]